MVDQTIIKTIALISMPIICIATCTLTQYYHRLHFNPNIMSYLNSFSTGMILSMTIVRFIPLAQSQLLESMGNSTSVDKFPWGFFVVLMTYLFFLFVDQIVFPHAQSDKRRVSKKLLKQYIRNQALKGQSDLLYDPDLSKNLSDSEDKGKTPSTSNKSRNKSRQFQTFLTVIVMSLQVFVSGTTVGLLVDTHHLIILMLAMYIHRVASSVVVGYLILQDNISKIRKGTYVIIYSLSTSLGLIFGIIMKEYDSNSLMVDGIMLAIAAGSLLYICVSDILIKEFSLKSSNWRKFLCLFTGMAVENSLWFIELSKGMNDS